MTPKVRSLFFLLVSGALTFGGWNSETESPVCGEQKDEEVVIPVDFFVWNTAPDDAHASRGWRGDKRDGAFDEDFPATDSHTTVSYPMFLIDPSVWRWLAWRWCKCELKVAEGDVSMFFGPPLRRGGGNVECRWTGSNHEKNSNTTTFLLR